MKDDAWLNVLMYVLPALIIVLISLQIGIWHGRRLERVERCDEPVICQKINGGLKCNRM